MESETQIGIPTNSSSASSKKKRNFILLAILIVLFSALGILIFILLHDNRSEYERLLDFDRSEATYLEMRPSGNFSYKRATPPDFDGEFTIIFEEYLLYDTETHDVVSLGADDVKLVAVSEAPPNAYADFMSFSFNEEYDGLRVNVFPAPFVGEYEILIRLTDGRTYVAKLNWIHEPPSFTPANSIEQAQIDEDGAVSYAFSIGNLDLSDFQAMVHLHPDGTIEKLKPRGDALLSFIPDHVEEGEHIFLIKQDDLWHYTTIHNPNDL